jgi:hypothetical protein
MFYASLLFCWLSVTGPQCLVAEDTYGPYPTVAECQKRLKNMSEAITNEMPEAVVRGQNCTKLTKGEYT